MELVIIPANKTIYSSRVSLPMGIVEWIFVMFIDEFIFSIDNCG